MDHVLRFLRSLGAVTILCIYSLVWHGLCWNPWYGLGVADRYVFHPMRRYGHG